MTSEARGYLPQLSRTGLVPEQVTAALLVGSVARGWSNPGSDVDVIFVYRDGSSLPPLSRHRQFPLRSPIVHMETTFVGGRKFDLEYWRDSQVDQVVGKVDWSVAERDDDIDGVLLPREVDFLDRLVRAVPLTGADWLADRVDELKQSALSSVTAARSLHYAHLLVDDAAGQLRSGDLESSVLSAKLAFNRTVDGLLASCGEYGQQPKWRVRRLRAVEQDILAFDTFWAIETMRDFDAQNPEAWIVSVLSQCRKILSKIRI